MAQQTLLQTPLRDRHVALGARLVPFAGWEMPVQYEGVIPEHRAVRTDARCSWITPSYWTGISQPAKGTRRAPSAACRSRSGVCNNVC